MSEQELNQSLLQSDHLILYENESIGVEEEYEKLEFTGFIKFSTAFFLIKLVCLGLFTSYCGYMRIAQKRSEDTLINQLFYIGFHVGIFYFLILVSYLIILIKCSFFKVKRDQIPEMNKKIRLLREGFRFWDLKIIRDPAYLDQQNFDYFGYYFNQKILTIIQLTTYMMFLMLMIIPQTIFVYDLIANYRQTSDENAQFFLILTISLLGGQFSYVLFIVYVILIALSITFSAFFMFFVMIFYLSALILTPILSLVFNFGFNKKKYLKIIKYQEICPIDLEELDFTQDLIILECKHSFHKSCINQFENYQKSYTCPICRFMYSPANSITLEKESNKLVRLPLITKYTQNLKNSHRKVVMLCYSLLKIFRISQFNDEIQRLLTAIRVKFIAIILYYTF